MKNTKTNTKIFLEIIKKIYTNSLIGLSICVLGVALSLGAFLMSSVSVPADAYPYCPNGTWNGTGCLNSYSCPNGWLLSGTSCYEFVTTYSCPNGGALSGASCIASAGSPVYVGDGCWAGGTYVASIPTVIATVAGNTTLSSYSGPLPACFGPNAGIPAGTLLAGTGLTPIGTIQGYNAGYHTSGAFGAASSSGYVYRQAANPVYNNTGAVFIPESGDLTGLGCQTVNVGQLTSCTYAINNTTGLPTTLAYLNGELYVQGTADTFLFDNTNSALDGSGNLVVSNIPTAGGTTGSALPVATAIFNPSTSTVGNLPANKLPNLTLIASTIDINDLTNLKIQCGSNNFVIVPSGQTSTTTTCEGVIPSGKSLASTTNLKLKIGNASDTLGNLTICTQDSSPDTVLNGNTSDNTFTCTNVPSGSLTAGQIIYGTVYETNATPPSYTDSLRKTNVYSADYYSDGKVNFLKGTTGSENGYNNILHNDWRRGVAGTEARLQLTDFKSYRDVFPGTTSSSETNNGTITNPAYTCTISVRPSGATGNYTNLVYDSNNNGAIDAGETSTSVPYSTTTNSCQTLFTNSSFTGGQTAISISSAKTYVWEVKIDVVDTSLSGSPVVGSFKTNVGFKFAAIIPGG